MAWEAGRMIRFAAALASAATICVAAGSTWAASDTKVALVPGGPHPYFAAWEQAAADAKRDFGLADDEYKVPPKWELSAQNELIESTVSQGFNAFGIFPGDAVGTNATMQELAGFGVPSIALAGCTKDPTPALFCMGTDVARSAYLGTKELLKALGNKGNIAHFTGFLVDPNTQLRIQAVEKAVAEAGGGAKVVQVIADIDAPQPADEKINAFLAAQGKSVDGIITTAWVPSVVAANSLRNLGDKRIKMVGIDHDEVVLKAIKDGFVDGTMLQNPYGQGYIGSWALNRIRSGCKVKKDAPFKTIALTNRFIDSGTVYADKGAVDNYVGSMQAITKQVFATFEKTYLDCP
jgi:ribose transport system substrate-binding protein